MKVKSVSAFALVAGIALLFSNCDGDKSSSGVVNQSSELPGKPVYENNCSACHGMKGEGDGPAGAALNPKPRNYAKDGFKYGSSIEEVKTTVRDGIEETAMASYAEVLTDEQITQVAEYVKWLASRSAE